MRRLSKVLLLMLVLLLALAPPAQAADLRQGEAVVVGPNETINDDLYVGGGTVQMYGTVNGDLVAFGGTILIGGTVNGNVIAAGGTVTVAGPVRGTVRAAGGIVTVGGSVERDLLLAGGTLVLEPSARAGRDLLLGGGSATVSGAVGRHVLAGAGELTIGGPVGGNVRAEVDALRLTPGAAIAGSLSYTSEREAEIAPGATVRGTVERRAREPRRAEPAAGGGVGDSVVGWLRALVGTFALGLLLILVFPGFSQRAVGTVAGAPWSSLGLGILLLVGVPLAALLLFGVGLIVGGWWLALMALALYGSALALGYVLAGLALGRWLLRRAGRAGVHLAWSLLLGLAVLIVLSTLPWVGWLVGALAVLLSAGALAIALVRAGRAAAVPVAAG